MAILHRTFANLYNAVERYWVANATPSATDTANAKRCVNDGYLEVLTVHDWDFLTPQNSITLWTAVAVSATATVVASGTTVTCTGATPFYASMVGRTITLTGITPATRTITGYTSSTVVTVDSTFTGSHTFSITAGDYGLPDNFAELIDRFTFPEGYPYSPLKRVSPEQIRQWRSTDADPAGEPIYFAIVDRSFTTTTDQRYDLIAYPTPDETRAYGYRARVNATELTSDSELPMGGPEMSMVYEAAALAKAEVVGTSGSTFHRDRFYKVVLPAAIQRDLMHRTRNLGPCLDDSDQPTWRGLRQETLTSFL